MIVVKLHISVKRNPRVTIGPRQQQQIIRKNKNNVTTLHDSRPRHHEAKGTFLVRLEIK